MAIRWTFKHFLASKHQIYSVTDLQKKVVQETGVVISVSQLCKLVNRTPSMIRFETTEILTSALNCELSDFLTISAKKMNPAQQKKLSYKNTPRSKIGVKAFPSPSDYKTDK
jgi:DNA-binding Xre family transcriptional regulator